MTMPRVATTQGGMENAAREFADKANEFNGYLKSVNSQMAVLQASWTGKASNGFNQAMDSWEKAFQGVINELVHMLEAMHQNVKGITAAEDQAANTAQSFVDALPGI
ncbi:WXG100 family type VII secretion target [Micromonospora sp. NPDC005367]|uniref:WXG100 family type VII secretion target n=1 Tax=Micromonospora sp. NPDC005367 TaxID=3155590 RepID=UPI0033B36D51